MKLRPALLALLISVSIPATAERHHGQGRAEPVGCRNLALGGALDPDDRGEHRVSRGLRLRSVGQAGPRHARLLALDEGAGDLPSEAFKQALEARAIRLGASADRDYITVSMTTLKENADEAFRLLGLVLTRPRFDPKRSNACASRSSPR